jgi:plasmid maintenance system antidote protein VapI
LHITWNEMIRWPQDENLWQFFGKGKRKITADTALRLSSYFGNPAKFRLGLQDNYDIEEEKIKKESFAISGVE